MSDNKPFIGKMILCFSAVFVQLGCAQSRLKLATATVPNPSLAPHAQALPSATRAHSTQSDPAGDRPSQTARTQSNQPVVRLVSDEQPERRIPADSSDPPPELEQDEKLMERAPLGLEEVIDSVIGSYPLLRSAMLGRNIAQGELLAANGEFDLKLKADTLNMPLGFYENYRQLIGAEQPLFGGGSLFGGYRLGTGNFPTYYGERQTNLGGEFKAGVSIPLVQNRAIDDRRARLWRNRWDVQAVEPEIQAQLIEFIRVASITYWNWLAAGNNVRISAELLQNATERNDGLRIRVQRGDASPIELTDNERLIVSRRTKLLDAQRKFQQTGYKLSLFLRDEFGQPAVIDASRLPAEFPQATDPSQSDLETDITSAITSRPELRSLAILSEQLDIDLAAARNLGLPQLDAVLVASQDVGNPADPKKDDKSPFEFEGGLIASVPLQRRKARGKTAAIEGKVAQVRAKRQFTQDKIVAEVQTAHAALIASFQQLDLAHRALDLARQMEAAERRKFDLGDSNLLLVNIREQATADTAATEVEARLNYFDARADYRAALASDVLP